MENRQIDLTSFKRVQNDLIAEDPHAWDDAFTRYYRERLHKYTPEEIDRIIESSSLDEQRTLSRDFFEMDGLYKRIILHYATLLKYSGILIPNPAIGFNLSDKSIQKRYFRAVEYLDKLNIPEVLTRISTRALVDGVYYGIISSVTKEALVLIDLPAKYCRSRFKDIRGNDVIEFNVVYFDEIYKDKARQAALSMFPEEIVKYYRSWKAGKKDLPWVRLSAELGICFTFADTTRPLFLDVIPATLQYDKAVDTDQERALEEIRKIVVQHIPHLTDGQLVFEPDEALEMHKGTVSMLRGNKNLSVLTTYADVEVVSSKTTNDNAATIEQRMMQNVYTKAGVSQQIFAPEGSQAINTSILNDINLMMILGNKYSRFIEYIINVLFSNQTVDFSYSILPISLFNQTQYITDSFKLAQSGYSFLVPAIALGFSQRELTNLKDLENVVLQMEKKLVPLQSAYTQSASGNPVGRPQKPLEEKSPKTIANEESLDRQGGL